MLRNLALRIATLVLLAHSSLKIEPVAFPAPLGRYRASLQRDVSTARMESLTTGTTVMFARVVNLEHFRRLIAPCVSLAVLVAICLTEQHRAQIVTPESSAQKPEVKSATNVLRDRHPEKGAPAAHVSQDSLLRALTVSRTLILIVCALLAISSSADFVASAELALLKTSLLTRTAFLADKKPF